EIERLGQVIEGAALDRSNRRIQVAKRRHHDDRRILRKVTQPSQGGQAIQARQTHIEKNGVGPLLLSPDKRLLGGGGHGNLMSFARQGTLQSPADGFFIIDKQNVAQSLCSEKEKIATDEHR